MNNLFYFLNKLDEVQHQLHQILIDTAHALNRFYLDPDSWDMATKKDDSPVTTADHFCHDYLIQELQKLGLNIPIISEESTETELQQFQLTPPDVYWLIDPLDGTKGFVNGTGHFAVNVALVYKTRPIAGWVVWPRVGLLCWAFGHQSFNSGSLHFDVEQPESIHHLLELRQQHQLVVYSSTSQSKRKQTVVQSLQHILKDAAVVDLGAAIKFCAMFKGYGDLYPRLGHTCLWDLAAGQVLLQAKGGDIFCLNGLPMAYDLRLGVINSEFLAVAHDHVPKIEEMIEKLNGLHEQFS